MPETQDLLTVTSIDEDTDDGVFKSYYFDISLHLTIRGDGTSLWCNDKWQLDSGGKAFLCTSKGDWHPTSGSLCGMDLENDGGSWTLTLHGPELRWQHYTDNLIEKEVNEKLKPLLEKAAGLKIQEITWSEQGLQPEDGWNFDVFLQE